MVPIVAPVRASTNSTIIHQITIINVLLTQVYYGVTHLTMSTKQTFKKRLLGVRNLAL